MARRIIIAVVLQNDPLAVEWARTFRARVVRAERTGVAHGGLFDEAGDNITHLEASHQPPDLIEEARQLVDRALKLQRQHQLWRRRQLLRQRLTSRHSHPT